MAVHLGLRHTSPEHLLCPGDIPCTASDLRMVLRMVQHCPCVPLLVGWNWLSLQPRTGVPGKGTRWVMKPW